MVLSVRMSDAIRVRASMADLVCSVHQAITRVYVLAGTMVRIVELAVATRHRVQTAVRALESVLAVTLAAVLSDFSESTAPVDRIIAALLLA